MKRGPAEDLSRLTDKELWARYQERNSKAKYFEEVRTEATEIIERFGRAAENN
jgi:hypothetical protein